MRCEYWHSKTVVTLQRWLRIQWKIHVEDHNKYVIASLISSLEFYFTLTLKVSHWNLPNLNSKTIKTEPYLFMLYLTLPCLTYLKVLYLFALPFSLILPNCKQPLQQRSIQLSAETITKSLSFILRLSMQRSNTNPRAKTLSNRPQLESTSLQLFITFQIETAEKWSLYLELNHIFAATKCRTKNPTSSSWRTRILKKL